MSTRIVIEARGVTLAPEVGADVKVRRQSAPRLRPRTAAGAPGRTPPNRRHWCGKRKSRPLPSCSFRISTRQKRNGASSTRDTDLLHRRHERKCLSSSRLRMVEKTGGPAPAARLASPYSTTCRHWRFACRDRRRTADSISAPGGSPFPGRAGVCSVPGRSRQAFETLIRFSALGSPMVCPEFDRLGFGTIGARLAACALDEFRP